MSSILRRTGTKLVRALARAADPAAQNDQMYSKLVAAVAQIFARSSGGIVHQLSGPAAILPTGYVDGLALSWLSISTVQVAAGQCRASDDTFDIVLAGAVTANIANVGVVNGLDAGVEANDTWYAVWVIADSTGVNPAGSLLSTSFTAPVLPAGYDKKRRVGAVRNTGADFANFFMRRAGRTRRFFYNRNQINALAGGNATAFSTVDLSAFMPPTARQVVMDWRHFPNALGALTDVLSIRVGGGASTDGPHSFRRATVLTNTTMRHIFETATSATQTIQYLVSSNQNQVNLAVLAYDDEI